MSKSPSRAATRPNHNITTRPNHSEDTFKAFAEQIPRAGGDGYASLAEVKFTHTLLIIAFLIQCFCAGATAFAKPEMLLFFIPMAAILLVGIIHTKWAQKNYASH